MYLPSQLGFTFAGKHTMRDWGLYFIPDAVYMAGGVSRNEYEIGGADGTLLLSGLRRGAWQLKGALYRADDVPTYSAQSQSLRQIIAWLRCGRDKLILDYETDKYYLAQVDGVFTWTDKTWMEGGLPVTFTVQPGAWAVAQSSYQGVSEDGACVLSCTMDGTADAPPLIRILNSSADPISAVTVSCGGKSWALSGLALAQGERLTISCAAPAGASIRRNGEEVSVLDTITRADKLLLAPGENTVTVSAQSDGDVIFNAVVLANAKYE